MLFSSITFLFAFLPFVLLLYYISTSRTWRNNVLLGASLLFYAWGEPKYLLVMLVSILVTWASALWVDAAKRNRLALTVGILADLGLLVYFKYTGFILENIYAVFAHQADPIHLALPIGISFYTFQAISYLVDVYRGEVAVQRNVFKLALFITMFPQLVAGPIVKYHSICFQIDVRGESVRLFSAGVRRFCVGLAKKMLIANTMAVVADGVFNTPVSQFDTLTAWVGMVAYTFQIYYDFSAYSDMAIGLCMMFGFRIPENFNYPYISTSISEFWRRWHISLSTWFREYVYIPLGGNRAGQFKTYRNLGIVFLVTGVWHGASWCFVIWGLWHGLFILVERAMGWNKKQSPHGVVRVARHIYTLLIVMVGWVFFRADTLEYGWAYILTLVGAGGGGSVSLLPGLLENHIIALTGVALLCSMPLCRNLYLFRKPAWCRVLADCWIAVLLVYSVAAMAASTYNPFIYFRF